MALPFRGAESSPRQALRAGSAHRIAADSIPLGNTHDQSYSVRIVDHGEVGVYQAFYGVETPGGTVPRNQELNFECVVLEEPPPI